MSRKGISILLDDQGDTTSELIPGTGLTNRISQSSSETIP